MARLLLFIAVFTFFRAVALAEPPAAACARSPVLEQATTAAAVLASDQQPACTDMAIGDSRMIRISEGNSPTGVPHSYRLRRASASSFEVSFRLRLGVSDRQKRQGLEKRVRDCLAEANELWKEPGGDRSLSFRLAEANEDVPPIDIRVGRTPDGRNYSDQWNESIQCHSIMHELLHHAGLVDEYSERDIRLGASLDHRHVQNNGGRRSAGASRPRPANGPAYDCRKVWNDLAIMNNAQFAYMALSAPQLLTIDYCECADRRALDRCRTAATERRASPPHASCPEGFRVRPGLSATYPQFPDMGIVPPAPAGLTRQELALLVPIHSVSTVNDEQRSFFRERYFNAIAYPGCLAKNASYYADAENAYRTSAKRGGSGCRTPAPSSAQTSVPRERRQSSLHDRSAANPALHSPRATKSDVWFRAANG